VEGKRFVNRVKTGRGDTCEWQKKGRQAEKGEEKKLGKILKGEGNTKREDLSYSPEGWGNSQKKDYRSTGKKKKKCFPILMKKGGKNKIHWGKISFLNGRVNLGTRGGEKRFTNGGKGEEESIFPSLWKIGGS